MWTAFASLRRLFSRPAKKAAAIRLLHPEHAAFLKAAGWDLDVNRIPFDGSHVVVHPESGNPFYARHVGFGWFVEVGYGAVCPQEPAPRHGRPSVFPSSKFHAMFEGRVVHVRDVIAHHAPQ